MSSVPPPTLERVTVQRDALDGLPGVRCGRVAAYEFDLSPQFASPSGETRQRVFLLLDEAMQLNQPLRWARDRPGWWYIDLVRINESADRIEVRDLFLDVIVGPPGHPYRLLDLDELGEALRTGDRGVTVDETIEALTAMQRFLDRRLNRRRDNLLDWPDFPPADLAPLLGLPSPLR